MRFAYAQPGLLPLFITALLLAMMTACADDGGHTAESAISSIENEDELTRAVQLADNDGLVIIEFYADWCDPCKRLAPVLEEIAWEHSDRLDVFRIDYEKNKSMAQRFGVRGIPYVTLVRNGKIIKSMLGERPKADYVNAIESFVK
ncbi:MAG: redoxin domain-containing protein [Desulfobacterales bacterium]|nr:redoxin domain-containing protein [Desulfobacterales bacterium]